MISSFGTKPPSTAASSGRQIHDQQHVQRGEAHTPDERQAEEQVQRDGRADDFREVARADGQFAQAPQHHGHGLGIMVAARLREVAPCHDAELGAQRLQKDRHEVRHQDDGKQRVAKGRAAGEIGGPVAGVHVADGHEVARAGEGKQLAPEAERLWHGDAAIHFSERRLFRRLIPAGVSRGIFLG
jgi:hypothetical protein